MTKIISPAPKLMFHGNDGAPLIGGKLYTYVAGTTTPLATYTDSTGATTNANPVILDARGEASVWLDQVAYKFVLKTSTDVTVSTVDNIMPVSPDLWTVTQTGTGAVERTAESKAIEVFSVKDFGAVGDGTTDDWAAIQACLDAAAAYSVANPWLSSGDYGTITQGASVKVWFPRGVYCLSQPLTLGAGNRGIVIDNASLLAIGSGWATTDFLIQPATASTDVRFGTLQNSRLNCANKCGGIWAKGPNWRVLNTYIEYVAGSGIHCDSSNALIHGCTIGQWRQVDSEFFHQSAYTGIGITTGEPDSIISNCQIKWLYECIRLSEGGYIVDSCHLFNGMEDSCNRSAWVTATAYAAHTAANPVIVKNGGTVYLCEVAHTSGASTEPGVGASWATVWTAISEGRTYHPLLVLENVGTAFTNTILSNSYLDNGTIELEIDSIQIQNCTFASNQNISNAADTYWIKCTAREPNQPSRLIISGWKTWVESRRKQAVVWADNGANTWTNKANLDIFTDVAAADPPISYYADLRNENENASIAANHIFVTLQTGSAITLANVADSCLIEFLDVNTVTPAKFGAIGDNLFGYAAVMALTNTAGDATLSLRADLGADPAFSLREADTLGDDSSYTERGKLYYDNAVDAVALMSTGDLRLRAYGNTARVNFDSSGNFKPFANNTYTLGTSSYKWQSVYSNSYALTDGVSVPSTVSGNAQLFVDSADTDVKIKRGDGTVGYFNTDIPVATDGRSLTRWKARAARHSVDDTEILRVAVLGDSWAERVDIPEDLNAALGAENGISTTGWIPVFGTMPTGITNTSTGWTQYDGSADGAATNGCGPDGKMISATGTTATVVISGWTATAFAVYYKDTTGTFRYNIDGGSWTTVAGGNTGAFTKLNITGLSATSHTINIDLTGNTGTVRLLGYRPIYLTSTGVYLHKLGNGGLRAEHWDNYLTELPDAFADLIPDVVVVIIGTNDTNSASTTTEGFFDSLCSLVDAIRDGAPYAGIIFVMPNDTNGAKAGPSLPTLRELMYSASRLKNVEFLSLYDMLGSYAEMNTLGLFDDTFHINERGARVLTTALMKHFLSYPI